MSSGAIPRAGRSLLWNATERRPRAPVRILLAVVLLVIAAVLGGVAVRALGGPTRPALAPSPAMLVGQATPIPVVLLAAYGIDRRVPSDLGLGIDRDWWAEFALGSALGAALMSGVFAVALAAGWIRIDGTIAAGPGPGAGVAGSVGIVLAFWLVVGVSEELVVRGYLLTNVAEGLAGYVPERVAVGAAVVVSASLFGLIHAANPNASAAGVLGIGAAGVLLGLGYVVTDELAIPIGLHVAWNLFQGSVYGFGVSGFEFGVALIEITETGPDPATGGAFGPEAGLLGLGASVVGSALLLGYARLRDGTVGPAAGVTRPDLRAGVRDGDRTE